MMPVPPVSVHFPSTPAEAVALHAARPEARYLAGGTDLIPNLKHGLYAATDLVSLTRLALCGVSVDRGAVTIGAGTILADLADHPVLLAELPALADALGLVAGPLHRNRATIGGNVMLDTRCLYYNQSAFWRRALGHCLKRDGDRCHVIGSGRRCIAAASNDSAPLLMALDAQLSFETLDGTRDLPIRSLYAVDGRVDQHHTVSRSALLTAIRIPAPMGGRRLAAYRKVRRRGAIDFPQLGVAVTLEVGPPDAERVVRFAAVLGALMPQPRLLTGVEFVVGTRLEDAIIARVAARAAEQAHAQESIHGSPEWRKDMAGVEMRRALEAIRASF
ncbi:MAG: FAD binding domain-containing protein [Gemmatimonadales bacterium]